MAHTTGPWTVGEERLEYDCIIRGPKREPIASSQMAGYTKAEARSNACLIAAAPELLGALRFILAFYEPGQRHLDTEAWKRAEAAGRAAVAKAEGKP